MREKAKFDSTLINYITSSMLQSSLDQLGHIIIDIVNVVNIHRVNLGGLGSLDVRGGLGGLGSDQSLTSERSDLLGFRAGLGLESLLSEEGGSSGEGEL